jgi:nucleotide-binding universal stress UspA family protein
MAKRMGAELTFFHVMARPPAVFEGMEDEENPAVVVSEHSGLGRLVERQNRILDSLGVKHSVKLRYGYVLNELRQELEAVPYDLVVIGARQKGGGGYFMDDLTRDIIESVSCSVLVVRTVVEPSGGWFNRLRRWVRRR